MLPQTGREPYITCKWHASWMTNLCCCKTLKIWKLFDTTALSSKSWINTQIEFLAVYLFLLNERKFISQVIHLFPGSKWIRWISVFRPILSTSITIHCYYFCFNGNFYFKVIIFLNAFIFNPWIMIFFYCDWWEQELVTAPCQHEIILSGGTFPTLARFSIHLNW